MMTVKSSGARLPITLLCITLLLGGCMASMPTAPPVGPDESSGTAFYQQGVAFMEAGRHEQAAASLAAFIQGYPRSDHQADAWLALAYSQLQLGQAQQAVRSASQVIQQSEAAAFDYALYLRASALLSIRPGPSVLQARQAMADLGYLGERYPDSPYAAPGEKMRVATLERLAARELEAARGQLAAGNPVAALNRCRYLIENYPHSGAVNEALEIMVTAYQGLGLVELADSTQAILAGQR